MGFNLGVALGAGTAAGVNEYQRLRQNAWEDRQRAQIQQEWDREQARNAAYGRMPTQVDPSDAQGIGTFIDQQYKFSDDPAVHNRAVQELARGIAADPSKASQVLSAYSSYRRASPSAMPTQAASSIPQQPNSQQAQAQAIDTGKDSFGNAYDAPTVRAVPNAPALQGEPIWGGSPNPNAGISTQGALPDYTGQDTALPAASLSGGPALSASSGGPGSTQVQTPIPAPAPGQQPIDHTNPPMTDSRIDVSKYHAYTGHDGKVYLSTGTPRNPSPAEIARYHAIELAKLPDEKAQQQSVALMQQSYAMAKQEHDYQADQITQQVVTGQLSWADGIRKLAGAVSNSSSIPGQANVQITSDPNTGQVAANLTLDVPGGKAVTHTITADSMQDLYGKALVGYKSLFDPHLYQQGVANSQKAQELLIQSRQAAAHEKQAQAMQEFHGKGGTWETVMNGRNQVMIDRLQKQIDAAGDKTKQVVAYSDDGTKMLVQTNKGFHVEPIPQGFNLTKKVTGEDANKDLTAAEQLGLQAVHKDLSELPRGATDADIRKVYERHGVGHLYQDTFGNAIKKNMPPAGGSFFGGGNGKDGARGTSAPSAPPVVKPAPSSAIPAPTAMLPVDDFDLALAERWDLPLIQLNKGMAAATAMGNQAAVQEYLAERAKRIAELRAQGATSKYRLNQ